MLRDIALKFALGLGGKASLHARKHRSVDANLSNARFVNLIIILGFQFCSVRYDLFDSDKIKKEGKVQLFERNEYTKGNEMIS